MFDLSLVFFFLQYPGSFYIQQHECSRSFVRSLVARHLIRRWNTGNLKVFSIQKDINLHIFVGIKLVVRRQFDNQFNKFAVKLLNGQEMVGHLQCKYYRIALVN